MRKILLVMTAMMLSIGMYADDITHRYPAIPFTYNGHTYEMPGWDVKLTDDADIRIQTIAPLPTTTSDHFKGKIVARRVFNNDSPYQNGDYMFSSSPTEADIIIGGKKLADLPVEEGETAPTKWTYGLACDVLGITIADEARSMEVFTIKLLTRENYTIPGTYTVKHESASELYRDRTFDIVEIGVGAFRNSGPTSPNLFKITGTLTIPNTITKIEHNAFRHGYFMNVVFEAGSTVNTIEKATFEGCKNLETINIPASVTTIKGTAFGSCTNLHKIVFEGNLPTLTKEDEEPLYTGYKGPYTIFEGAQRFISNGTTGANVTPANCSISVPMKYAANYDTIPLIRSFKELSSPIAFPACKMATCCSSLPFTLSEGVKAYFVEGIAAIHETYVTLTEVEFNGEEDCISDRDGYILIGTTGTEEIVYPVIDENEYDDRVYTRAGNKLEGVIADTPMEIDEDYYYLVLIDGEFKLVTDDGTLPANKAYLQIGKSEIQMDLSKLAVTLPEETGIVNHETQGVQDNVYYTLQGIQLSQPQKGLVIKNGKKYIVK